MLLIKNAKAIDSITLKLKPSRLPQNQVPAREYAFESKVKLTAAKKIHGKPFGCGVILGGYDIDGPQLYMIKPSGVSYKYYGIATGKGRQAAKTYVDQLWIS
ncbi:hypothetical protein POM88_038895 [Heracleum sosnowskyi]|uniref:Uncharacterized protein n=1 Tax=Heracleum sosnowskyi TaxID=360622 RepID=A0AAD8M8A1_9APIA|nr:hypothetical protein POM88_038895 [Heracleum sosnowskyi]